MNNYISYYRELARNKQNTAAHTVILCAYKAINAKNDQPKVEIFTALLDRAFTPITNTKKLNNGRKPYDTLMTLLSGARLYYNGNSCPALLQVLKECNATAEEITQYQTFFKQVFEMLCRTNEMPRKYYTYVFVDTNLTNAQRAVQASHASIELGHALAKENTNIDHLHLVMCGITPELSTTLDSNQIRSISFREPDLGNRITAIATWPIESSQKKIMKNFKLI